MKAEKTVFLLAVVLALFCSSINTIIAQENAPDPLVQQSIILFEQGKFKQASVPLEKYLKQEPENTNALILMGIIQGSTGEANKAISYFNKVIELNPKDWKPYSLIANTYRAQGQYSNAISYYQRGLNLKNIDKKTRDYLTGLLNETKEALKQAKK